MLTGLGGPGGGGGPGIFNRGRGVGFGAQRGGCVKVLPCDTYRGTPKILEGLLPIFMGIEGSCL